MGCRDLHHTKIAKSFLSKHSRPGAYGCSTQDVQLLGKRRRTASILFSSINAVTQQVVAHAQTKNPAIIVSIPSSIDSRTALLIDRCTQAMVMEPGLAASILPEAIEKRGGRTRTADRTAFLVLRLSSFRLPLLLGAGGQRRLG